MLTRGGRPLPMLLLTLVAVTAGCAPSPGPGPVVPVRGCYDDLRPDGADVHYTGEPSELDNLEWWTSTDGSCTGERVPETLARSTLIVATDAAAAEVLCRMLVGRDLLGAMDTTSGPWSPAFGTGAFRCVS